MTAIADTASKLASKGSTTLPASSPDLSSLSAAAGTLDRQIASLATTPSDVLGSASGVLSVLKPAVVVNQVLGVATGLTSLDMPAILANLDLLPQKVAALDAHGAHKIAGDLNNQFSPLVKMAAGVDLKWVSQVLSVNPGSVRLYAGRGARRVDPWEMSTSSSSQTLLGRFRKSLGPQWRSCHRRPDSSRTHSVPELP